MDARAAQGLVLEDGLAGVWIVAIINSSSGRRMDRGYYQFVDCLQLLNFSEVSRISLHFHNE